MKNINIKSINKRNNRNNKLTKYRRNTHYKQKLCSPKNNNNFTCFTKNSLIKMLKSWNDFYQNDKINYSERDKLFNLWTKLDNKLKNICTDEYCWTKQKFINRDADIKEEFRPEMPSKWRDNKNEWLTTLDIEAVMKQYEKKYEDFVFIGPVPIDFDKELHPGLCVIDELCNINLKKMLNRGKKRLGIIFNLDPHDKPGSHWVAMFADFDKENKVYYFDSYGYKEPNEVTILMKRLKTQAEELQRETNLYTNNVRHQFKNSECGIYSIHFILKLLEGQSFEDISNNIINDDDMEQNRDKLFIKYF
jgi:hypothetical protein